MKLQPIAILLTVSIGIAIQLQCFCGAVAAEEQEPGVPVESAPVEPGPSSIPADSAPVETSPSSVPSDSAPLETSPAPADFSPINSAPSSVPGSLNSQPPLQGTVEQKSIDVAPPNLIPPDMTSPVVPPFPGPILQSEKRRPSAAEPERESKGSLLGKLSKALLKGGANKNVPAAERPWWIPGHAFTDDSMVAPYHNLDIAWWDKRPMPNRPQWVRLSQSVTRYWRGTVSQPCFVLIAPMEQVPGNFTFRSRSFGGPRGWLQALNVSDKKGFPQYRYWLDQP